MSFVVPTLQPNLFARHQFGAAKIPVGIADPGGHPASGIVYLRGAVAPGPTYSPGPIPPTGLIHLFTLPAGMRPTNEVWITCQISKYLSLYDNHEALCVVRPAGQVLVKGGTGIDGAIFFDGVWFFAAGPVKAGGITLAARKRAAAPQRRAAPRKVAKRRG
jgi:hypothetical protein